VNNNTQQIQSLGRTQAIWKRFCVPTRRVIQTENSNFQISGNQTKPSQINKLFWFVYKPVHCTVLQCVAVCCIVLQCVAVFCSMLQCIAVCCSVLYIDSLLTVLSAAVCCSVLQCAAVCCSVLLCVACVLQCATVCCSVLQCAAVCCSMLKYVEECWIVLF